MAFINEIFYNRFDMESPFLCNVAECKGACCFIEGEFGAPLKFEEVKEITETLPYIVDRIPSDSRKVIEDEGPIVLHNGVFFTNVVNRGKCVFAFFENGNARCSFEQAFLEGKINFRKPISCQLFPIREYKFAFTELVYIQIPECKSAITNGKQHNSPLYRTLKDALIRRFGEQWYSQLVATIENQKSYNSFQDKLEKRI